MKAVNANSDASPASDPVQVTIPAGADVTGPIVTSSFTQQGSNTGNTAALDTQDVVTLGFDEAVNVSSGTSFTLADDDNADGVANDTKATITLGSNATYTQSSDKKFLFITLTAPPTVQQPSGTAGKELSLDSPVEITGMSPATGIQDTSGNNLSLVRSTDLVVLGSDTFDPLSTSVTTDETGGTTAGTLDDGDVITIKFNEPVAAITNTDTIEFTDGDGTVNTITLDGTEATATLSANGSTLTVSIDNLGAAGTAGTTPGLQIASTTITSQTGIADAAANAWNLSASSDVALS